jgi:thymidine kinase|tara:strand:+ start:325 stop:915 length:591 start_codon:yes stop_codon:yes gene_type:complete
MFLENSVHGNKQFGSIEVICGSMFSGKTEELIRRLKRAKIANQKIQIFKPSLDSRNNEYIESHDKNRIKSLTVKTSYDVYDIGKDFDVIGIDEVQFFDDEIVSVCNSLANNGVRVIAAGLDMDYLGNPFGPMPNLMAIAEYVTKVHAICSKTGNIANYSYRKNKEDSIILIGEKDEYEALSREIFYEKMDSKKKKT